MIYNVEIYNNHIRQTKELNLNSYTVETQAKQYPYNGEHLIRDESVENAKLPPIAIVFYSLIYEKEMIPSPERLIEEYLSQPYFMGIENGNILVRYDGNENKYSEKGIEARVYRTYPSLLRDFHFFLMANESHLFEAVRYSFERDYKGKIDIQVKFKNCWYNVGLCLASHRSFFFKFKKQFRHKPTDVIYIELDKSRCYMTGDYMLYTEWHVGRLKKWVELQSRSEVNSEF